MTTTEHIYLAGPMRNMPEFNFPAFYAAERELLRLGHEVCNPARYDEEVLRFRWEGLTGHENLADLGFSLRATFRHDITWIIDNATRIVVLPGWERSRGARAEVAVATSLGIEVHNLDSFLLWGTNAQDLTSRSPETGPPEVLERTDLANEDYQSLVKDISHLFKPTPTPPEPAHEPETILAEAERIVLGDRQADYGHPGDDLTRTGRLWGAILGREDIPAETVALCMVALKISREVNKPKRDNRVDMAGYAACVELVEQRKAEES